TYGGLLSALGILMALQERRRSGEGQYLDTSLYGAQLFMAAATLQPFLAGKNPLYSTQQSREQARNPLWNRYRARDQWLFLCVENTDEGWSALCASLDRSDLVDDERFATAQKRAASNTLLIARLGEILEQRDASYWMSRWKSAGIPASPIHDLKDVAADEQAWANDYLLKAHCGAVDREVEIRGLPITLSKSPGRVESLGPELGQDTELILMETLEMEWDRIEKLKAQGVIP
ncbi:MAG: CoA transferase, partial [Myxococcota bacterium]